MYVCVEHHHLTTMLKIFQMSMMFLCTVHDALFVQCRPGSHHSYTKHQEHIYTFTLGACTTLLKGDSNTGVFM